MYGINILDLDKISKQAKYQRRLEEIKYGKKFKEPAKLEPHEDINTEEVNEMFCMNDEMIRKQ